jgi:hypothetical protein
MNRTSQGALLTAAGMLATGVLAAGCSSAASNTTVPPSSPNPATASSSAPAASGTPGSSVPAGSAPASSASTAACLSSHLKASIGGGAGAGMSQDHTGLNLTNTGSTPCTLYGYPGVSWVAGLDGHQVGSAATKLATSTGPREATVTLAPGATASAALNIVQAAVISKSACKPVPVEGLRVYPPGETAALFIQMPTAPGGYGECSVPTEQTLLSVGFMQLGTQPG